MKKLNEFAKSSAGKKIMRNRIEELSSSDNTPDGYRTEGGSTIITQDMRDSLVYTFISMLTQSAHNASLPNSVERIFDTLDVFDIKNVHLNGGIEMTEVLISFNGKLLPRTSLYFYGENGRKYRTGNGIDNIVSLFDTGYSLNPRTQTPYGYWTGHEDSGQIYARRSRDRLGFMKDAIDRFNSQYGHIAIADFGDDVDGFYAR